MAPPPPPPPGSAGPGTGGPNRRRLLIVGAIVAVLLIAGVAVAVALSGGDKKHTAQTPTPTPTPTTTSPSSTASFPSGFPSDTGVATDTGVPTDSTQPTGAPSTSGGTISEDEAKATVEKYFQDINAQNESDAATLICAEVVDSWRSAIHGNGGDFTVTVTNFSFVSSTAASFGGLDVKYQLDLKSNASSQTGQTPITFTIIDQNGPKICGEQ
jgi:hypothetical protein